jgi:DNA-directed RNA polymerase sigma subunit (sigma70/sigma32)
MNEGGRKLDEERLALLLRGMSHSDLQQLEARSKSGPKSLTLDEVGILFLWTREKIRALEKKAGGGREER